MSFGSDIAGGIAARMIFPMLWLVLIGVIFGFGIAWLPTLFHYIAAHLRWL